MKAGRALDVLLTKKIFGTEVEHLNQQAGWRIDYRAKNNSCNDEIMTDWGLEGHILKHFSRDIASAWLLVEHLSAKGFEFSISSGEFNRGTIACFTAVKPLRVGEASSDSASEAICLAALEAIEFHLNSKSISKGDL